jgi:hypothetical protein
VVRNWLSQHWWWVMIALAAIFGGALAWQVCLLAGAFDLPALP